jgi:hypothetical protein
VIGHPGLRGAAAVLAAAVPIGAAFRALGQSATIEWGPEVEVPSGAEAGDLRAEPSVVIAESTVVVAWNDSYGGAHGSEIGVAIGWAISRDLGRTFAFGGFLPAADSGIAPSGADSWLARAPDGDIYLQLLTWQAGYQEILVYAMAPGHAGGWQRSASVVRGPQVDKPAMAVAPSGRVAIAYTAKDTIAVTRSLDGGRTWSTPVPLSAPESGRLRTGAGIAWCGDAVVVAWMEGGLGGLTELRVATSGDGGQRFTPASPLYRLSRPVTPPSGYALGVGRAGFIANNAWLACDGGSRDREPVFYVSVAEGDSAGSSILLFEGTLDRIATAAAVTVNAARDGAARVFPAVAITGGTPALLYYDRRLAPTTPLTDVFLSIRGRDDAFTDRRVTTRATDWEQVPGDRAAAPIQRNFGDYIFLATQGERFVAAWTDGRTGRPRVMIRVGRVRR